MKRTFGLFAVFAAFFLIQVQDASATILVSATTIPVSPSTAKKIGGPTVQQIVKVPLELIQVVRLPIGLTKSLFGLLLPKYTMASGFADIEAGILAPFKAIQALLLVPIAAISRI